MDDTQQLGFFFSFLLYAGISLVVKEQIEKYAHFLKGCHCEWFGDGWQVFWLTSQKCRWHKTSYPSIATLIFLGLLWPISAPLILLPIRIYAYFLDRRFHRLCKEYDANGDEAPLMAFALRHFNTTEKRDVLPDYYLKYGWY